MGAAWVKVLDFARKELRDTCVPSAARAGAGSAGRYKELGAAASQIATAAFPVRVFEL